MTEHWLKKESCFVIENFQITSAFIRNHSIHGGSLIMCKNNLKCKERKDILNLSIERIVELSCVETENFVIVCVYRPPTGDFNLFESTMEEVLRKVCNKNKSVAVCGDFNCNLLEDSSIRDRLICLFKSSDLHYQFLEPTRITATTATCIDNIFCNCMPVQKSVISSLTSDHCGQQISFNENVIYSSPTTRTCRPIPIGRMEKFREKIKVKIPKITYTPGDPDTLYKKFFNCIKEEFDHTFPTKVVTPRTITKFSDWATTGIFKSRNRLYELYDMKRYDTSPTFVEYVKKYSKLFKKVCSLAKSIFIRDKITKSSNKIKATWEVINRESGKIKPRDSSFTLKIEDKVINTDADVAETFEEYFTNIPLITTSTLNSSASEAGKLLKSCVSPCEVMFSFKYIDSADVIKTFRSLNLKNTSDLFGISVKFIGYIINDIATYLADIFNDCITEGVFPDLMKHSKIVPLFKSGNKHDPTNFRPISILPALSKIFEKIINEQLLEHFVGNSLFHREQYGFTKGRSTTDAGTALLKHIFEAWENSQNALGIFCDLSKAFDCVDHQTLINKLQHYGIHDTALKLVKSYLNSRIQRVDVNGKLSSGSAAAMGVPQGSILGPFLFLIYINDLPFFAQEFCKIVLFADDTSLIFNINRSTNNFDDVNDALAQILKWFTINNLQLNAKKTKCINFVLPNVKSSTADLKLNKDKLELVDTTVFLGITLDSKLQWNPHLTALAGRLSSAAFAIKKIRQLTDVKTARLVYFSYFHSIMSYGILIWGKAAEIQTIFILQKRAIRYIYKLQARSSLREFFKEIGILTVASQYIYNCIMYVHQNIDHFPKKCDLHNRNTRNKNKLSLPRFRLHKVSRSFVGQSIHFYNKIPTETLNLPFNTFKNYIKNTLMSKGYYTTDDYLKDKLVWK